MMLIILCFGAFLFCICLLYFGIDVYTHRWIKIKNKSPSLKYEWVYVLYKKNGYNSIKLKRSIDVPFDENVVKWKRV